MKTVLTLPESYRETETVDFQKNIKLTLWMTALMLLSAAAVFVSLQSAAPVKLFPLPHIPLADSLLFAAAAVLYAFINDLVHFITFNLCGTKYTLYSTC